METNAIYCGDCLFVLKHDFPADSVDLIYLDPPFFTGRVQKGEWSPGAMEISFEDSKEFWSSKRYAGAPEWMKHIGVKRPPFASYLYYMQKRLKECARVLKNTGSIYLHCDSHASHYLKALMDEIFDFKNFRDEIVWKRSDAHSDAKQGAKIYGRIHDIILFYSNSDDYTFNVQHNPLPSSTVEKWYRNKEIVEEDTINRLGIKIRKGKVRRYNKADLTAAKSGGDTEYEWHGVKPPKGRYWAYSKKNMMELEAKGLIVYSKSGKPYMKRYLDESKGVPLQDIWSDIPMLRGIRKKGERLGYPTQKPEALLERIIRVSSNKQDVVLDPFCGCGTTIASAQRLERRWIGIDISLVACKLMQKRMEDQFKVKTRILQRNLDEVMKLKPARFEVWVNSFYDAVKPSPDLGVDGITKAGIPIQTKALANPVGYDIVDGFLTSAKYHPKVSKPIKKMILFSQSGFDDKARARVFEIEQREGIAIQLVEPKDIFEAD